MIGYMYIRVYQLLETLRVHAHNTSYFAHSLKSVSYTHLTLPTNREV